MNKPNLKPWTVTYHKAGHINTVVVWTATKKAAAESTCSYDEITPADIVSVTAGEPR